MKEVEAFKFIYGKSPRGRGIGCLDSGYVKMEGARKHTKYDMSEEIYCVTEETKMFIYDCAKVRFTFCMIKVDDIFFVSVIRYDMACLFMCFSCLCTQRFQGKLCKEGHRES